MIIVMVTKQADEITLITQALRAVEDKGHGEVRLVVKNGKLTHILITESWQVAPCAGGPDLITERGHNEPRKRDYFEG